MILNNLAFFFRESCNLIKNSGGNIGSAKIMLSEKFFTYIIELRYNIISYGTAVVIFYHFFLIINYKFILLNVFYLFLYFIA